MNKLREAREKAGLSQRDLADRANLLQSQISRLEKESLKDNLTVSQLRALTRALGISESELLEDEPARFSHAIFIDSLAGKRKEVNELLAYLRQGEIDFPETANELAQFAFRMRRVTRRPIVLLRGRFDAGKSFLINQLVGADLLRSRFTPETGLVVYVCHSDSKPLSLSSNSFVFKSGFDIVDFLAGDLQNELLITEGSYDDVEYLNSAQAGDADANYVVIFHDAPVLRSVILCDSPGNSDEIDDNFKKGMSAERHFDAVIYASTFTNFLNAVDFQQIKSLLGSLPLSDHTNNKEIPIGNMIILATHVHDGIKSHQFLDAKNTSCKRLFNFLGESPEIERINSHFGIPITAASFSSNIQPFWMENDVYRNNLQQILHRLFCSTLHNVITERIDAEYTLQKNSLSEEAINRINNLETILFHREDLKKQIAHIDESESDRLVNRNEKYYRIIDSIEHLRSASVDSLNYVYNDVINDENIKNIIFEKFNDKQSAQEQLPLFLQNIVESRMNDVLQEKGREFSSRLEEFLEIYEFRSFYNVRTESERIHTPFDARGAFIGGLAGLSTFGALSIWAASLGNLGGYILTAKVGSLLTAIGISFTGGTATLINIVSTLGGPIAWIISFAIMAALTSWRLLGASWQERLASQINKEFHRKGLWNNFREGINRYWDSTKIGFIQGAEKTENDFQEYRQYLKNDLMNYNEEQILYLKLYYENLSNFVNSSKL